MLKCDIWLIQHDNNVTNLYAYKFDYEILNIANEITEIPRTAKKVVFLSTQARFSQLEMFPIIGGPPNTKFLANWFFIRKCISQNVPSSYKQDDF